MRVDTAVFVTWGLGIRPSWRGFRVTVAVTAAWAVAVYFFDVVVGRGTSRPRSA